MSLPQSLLARVRENVSKTKVTGNSVSSSVSAPVAPQVEIPVPQPNIAKVVLREAWDKNRKTLYSLNLGIHFGPGTDVVATVGLSQDQKTGKFTVEPRKRMPSGTPRNGSFFEPTSKDYTTSIWLGKPGGKQVDGAFMPLNLVPCGDMLDYFRATVNEATPEEVEALKKDGSLYQADLYKTNDGTVVKGWFLALSLVDLGMPLYIYGVTDEKGIVSFVPDAFEGVWSLGETPNKVEGRDQSNKATTRRMRGRCYGGNRRSKTNQPLPPSNTFSAMKTLLEKAVAMVPEGHTETVAKTLESFRGSVSFTRRATNVNAFAKKLDAQAPAAPVAAPAAPVLTPDLEVPETVGASASAPSAPAPASVSVPVDTKVTDNIKF